DDLGVCVDADNKKRRFLDPALLRAGRFDRQVLVDRADRSGRMEILKVQVAKVQLAANVDLDQIAGLTASALRRVATIAASLTRFARSAPVKPGVPIVRAADHLGCVSISQGACEADPDVVMARESFLR